jgi:hypothetical protein
MGQEILGSSHITLQSAVLDCDPSLVGDSLSVHLAQQGNSGAVWTLHVWVQIAQGWFHLGFITTTPPTVVGEDASRTVAIATCPGAIGWRVDAYCPTDDEIADLTLQSSRCCTSAIGVSKVNSSDVLADDPWLQNFSVALANSFVVSTAPGIARSLTLQIDGTLASGTYYLQLWNLAAVPADGTAVAVANGLLSPVKVVHVLNVDDTVRVDYDELGVEYSAGWVLNLSSTRFTKTTVAGTFLSVLSAEYRNN